MEPYERGTDVPEFFFPVLRRRGGWHLQVATFHLQSSWTSFHFMLSRSSSSFLSEAAVHFVLGLLLGLGTGTAVCTGSSNLLIGLARLVYSPVVFYLRYAQETRRITIRICVSGGEGRDSSMLLHFSMLIDSDDGMIVTDGVSQCSGPSDSSVYSGSPC